MCGKIAFIGTREYHDPTLVPMEHKLLYRLTVRWAVRWGYTVATGAAPGADLDAAEIALQEGGHVQLYLPWQNFNKADWEDMALVYGRLAIVVFEPRKHPSWGESVARYHPNPKALSAAAFRLMARNYGIVEGAKAVIALPRRRRLPSGQETLGGTGQGIRIAQALGIPVFDLSTEEGRETLRERMARFPAPGNGTV